MSVSTTITKEKIAQDLHKEMGLSFLICEEIVNKIFTEMTDLILRDEKLMLHRFGTWKLHRKNPRPGFNITHGNHVNIPARTVLQFTSSNLLRQKLNGK